jgi:hypothetical protein
MKNEKVLSFCHNLAPVRYIKLDVIDKFEDCRGGSKILLASINVVLKVLV